MLQVKSVKMSEKEKMIAGVPYNPLDPELYAARIHAKTHCMKYNKCLPNEIEKKHKLIKKLFGKTARNMWIEPNFFCDYGFNIEIGENFYSNHNLVILDPAKVTFGDNVFIGPNCGFYTASHPLDYKKRNSGIESASPITVGNNVWFGGNVVVLPGVNIGDNSVIGAGSVVTKDVPSNCVAAGNPCKVIKFIQE